MDFNYTIVTLATRYKQCDRCFSFNGADFSYYKLSEQCTFFTAYSSNGYNRFNVISVITDTVRLFDISPRFNFVQFLMLVDGMNHLTYITREYPEQTDYLELCYPYKYRLYYKASDIEQLSTAN